MAYCSKRRIGSLQKVQNRAARIVMNSAYDASAAPLIQSLGWPTISNLIKKETATLMYKFLNELAPEYMRNLFTRCSDSNGRVLRGLATSLSRGKNRRRKKARESLSLLFLLPFLARERLVASQCTSFN